MSTSNDHRIIQMPYTEPTAVQELSDALLGVIQDNTVIICVGTDRAIGDAIGPVLGSKLQAVDFPLPVYGTLHDPIHALNLHERVSEIKEKHKGSHFLAIDACLGSVKSIGDIQIRNKGIAPGKGVGKSLGVVGDHAMVAIVDAVREDNRFSFNNIRLSLIMDMTDIILESLLITVKEWS